MRRKLRDIAPRILVDNEIGLVQDFSESDRHEAVVLLFAMKEAIYKAIDPYVRRHVRFQEVEIRTEHSLNREIGHADVVMHLPEFGIVRPSVSVHWWKSDRHLFAIAESR